MTDEEDIITQATAGAHDFGDTLPESFVCSLRGRQFELSRNTLNTLPESILLSLSGSFTYGEQVPTTQSEHGEEITYVDFNPNCLEYITKSFTSLEEGLDPPRLPLSSFHDFTGFGDSWAGSYSNEHDASVGPNFAVQPMIVPEVLLKRPAVIVLREDIEYYCLRPSVELPREVLDKVKAEAGSYIVNTSRIFDSLLAEHAVDADTSPEYHLMHMLCLTGFSRADQWAFREREPHKTTVTSLQLVTLKLPDDPQNEEAVQAVQKLFLFWKRPARKCWWDKFILDVKGVGEVTVHVRKVWTLELSILGIE